LRALLWAALFPSLAFAPASARAVLRRRVAASVPLVAPPPPVLRVFLPGRSAPPSAAPVRPLPAGRALPLALAALFPPALRALRPRGPAAPVLPPLCRAAA
ncbi:hypothetical protein C3R44_24080, partial [Mycobacterium tuberculosis]